MKTTLLLIVLILCSACNGGAGSGDAKTSPSFIVDSLVTEYNWVRLVQVNPGDDDFEGFVVLDGYVYKRKYQKTSFTGTVTSITLEENFDAILTADNTAVITNRDDATDVRGVTFEVVYVNRLKICENGTCHIFDQLPKGSL